MSWQEEVRETALLLRRNSIAADVPAVEVAMDNAAAILERLADDDYSIVTHSLNMTLAEWINKYRERVAKGE